jgi:hypothetical protein
MVPGKEPVLEQNLQLQEELVCIQFAVGVL